MTLTPAEFHFLSHPLSANGIDLLKYTLQDLCIKEVIRLEARKVQVDSRLKRARVRYFFCRDKAFTTYNTTKSYELFILDLLHDQNEFRFYVLRQHVKKKFKKKGLELFKIDFVLKELAESKLSMLKYFPNKAGIKACKSVNLHLDKTMQLIDAEVDSEELKEQLKLTGSHIIFLPDEYKEKLRAINSYAKNIDNLRFLEILETQFQYFDHFFVSTAFVSGGGLSGFSGGFDGFGGGDFGGGGAIGGW